MVSRRGFLGGGAIALGVAATGAYILWPASVSLAETPVFTGRTDGIAINGYDPVAYFTRNEPVEGNAEHTATWRGVEWRFSTAENREAFEANPEQYAPQYGGYCAFAAANNYIAKTEPDAFTIVDGKLYLNYDRNIKVRWDQDQRAFIEAADRYWPELSKQ